jgi:hypothetical protein
MFTDVRTRASVVETRTELVDAPDSSGAVALGCLLHLLGPLGWLVGAILAAGARNPQEKIAKTRTVKRKVPVSQCRLCSEMQPAESIGTAGDGSVAFHVHPAFLERFLAANPRLDRQ